MNGVISGVGGFTKNGSGQTDLNGANTYTGATTLNSGILNLNGGAAIANTASLVVNGGTLNVNAAETVGGLSGTGGTINLATGNQLIVDQAGASTFSGAFTAMGGVGEFYLVKAGAGTLSLAGNNTGTGVGAVRILGGTLQLLGGNAIGDQNTIEVTSGTVRLLENETIGALLGGTTGTLDVNGQTLTLAGIGQTDSTSDVVNLAGSGVFRIASPVGSTQMDGAHTFTGTYQVSAGTLRLGGTGSALASLLVDGGTLDLAVNRTFNTVTLSSGTITGSGTLTSTGGFDVRSGTVSANLAGAVGLAKTTLGAVTLSGANTYDGVTTVSAGTLTVTNAQALGSGAGGTVVASGATLNLSGAFDNQTEAVTINGFGVGNVGALRSSGGSNGFSRTAVTLGSDARINSDNELSLNSVIGGGNALTLGGTGRLFINGNLSGVTSLTADGTGFKFVRAGGPSGATTVNNGVLVVDTTGSLSDTALVTVEVPGILRFGVSDTIGGLTGTGVFEILSGNLTTGANNASTTFAGVLGGSGGLIKTGTGIFTLSGQNFHSGTTTISGGTLQIGNGGTGGVLGSGNVVNNAALVFNRSDNLTVGNTISGSGSLTKQGAGTLTLSGTNSYNGVTTVSAGTLAISNATALGTTTGNTIVSSGAALLSQFAGTVAEAITLNGSGIGNGGALRIDANTIFSGAITLASAARISTVAGRSSLFTGGISGTNHDLTVNSGGSISIGSALSLGTGNLIKEGVADLLLTGSNTYGATTINAGGLIVGAGGNLGSGDVLNNGLLSFSRSDSITVGNAISGTGIVEKRDSGTLTLTGNNNYFGGTRVVFGRLMVGNNNALGTGRVDLDMDTTLQLGVATTPGVSAGPITLGNGIRLNRSANLDLIGTSASVNEFNGSYSSQGTVATLNGVIEGGHRLTIIGGGTLTLNGNNTYSLGTNIGQALVQIGNANALGTGSVTLDGVAGLRNTTGGALTLGNDIAANGPGVTIGGTSNLTLTGNLSGTGTLFKVQGNTLAINSAVNDFSGLLTVNGGTALVNGTMGNAAARVIVGNGGTLGGTGTIAGGVTVNSGGTLSAGQSPGTLTVGTLTLNAGSNTIFELAQAEVAGGPNNDLIRVTGTLALNGGGISVVRGTGFSAGQYTLFEFGTLTGAIGNLTLNPIGAGFNGNLALGTGTVLLNVAAAADQVRWNGSTLTPAGTIVGGSGTWDLVTTNFSNTAANVSGPWAGNGALAIFGGTTGGTVTIANDTVLSPSGLVFETDGYTISGGNAASGLAIAGPTGIETATGVGATINVGISGTGSLTKTGNGTLTLSGANSFSGGTSLLAGTLQVGNNDALGIGALTIAAGTLRSVANATLGNSIVILDGADATFSAAGGTTLTLRGDLTDNLGGITRFGTATDTGVVVADFGAVGTGQIITRAPESISIDGGTLRIGSSLVAFGYIGNAGSTSGGGVNVDGTLDLNGFSTTLNQLTGTGRITGNGNVVLNTSNGLADTTFGGVIENGSGILGLTHDGGRLTLTGANTYTGATRIEGGTLALGANDVLSDATVLEIAGGILDLGTFSDTVASLDLSGGGSIIGSGGSLAVDGDYGQSFGTLAAGATVNVGTIGALRLTGGTIEGTLTGARTGAGAGVVDGTNVAVTGTLALAGDLQVGNVGAGILSISSGGTANNAGAVLGNDAGSTGIAFVTGAGSRWDNAGTLVLGSGGAAFMEIGSGGVVTSTGTATIGLGADASASAVVSGTGSRWDNMGALQIGRAGNGTLALAQGGAVTADTVGIALEAGSTGLLQFGAAFGAPPAASGTLNTQSIAFGAGNGTILFNHTTSGLALAADISGTGTIQHIAGTTRLSGTLALGAGLDVRGGQIELSGPVTVAGRVGLLNGASLAFGTPGGAIGSLAGSGSVQLGAGTLTVGSDNTNTQFSGVISGSGGLTKVGTGGLTLGGANTFTGLTTIDAGLLLIDFGGTLAGGVVNNAVFINNGGISEGLVVNNGSLSSLNRLSGGLLNNVGARAVLGGSIRGDIANAGLVELNDGFGQIGSFTQTATGVFDLTRANTTIGSLAGAGSVLLGARTLTLGGNNASTSFDGVIGGTGGLTKTGTGTFTLTGVNTYTGGTTIGGGTLQIGNGGTSGSIMGAIVNNGVLAINRSDAVTLANAISGTGVLVQDGTGTLTLTGANSYTGGTLVRSGRLIGTTATLQGPIQNDGVLEFAQIVDGTYGGVLTGSGRTEKTGSGLLTFTGDGSAFAGPFAVLGGGLRLDGRLDSAVVTLASGTTLSGNGVIGGLVVESGVTVAPGASVGTLGVLGDVVFQAGSRLIAETTETGADLIRATGTARLAGVLEVVNIGGADYRFNTALDLVVADGGVTGAFDAVSFSGFSPVFRPTLRTTNTGRLVLVLAPNSLTAVAGPGLSANQAAVAAGFDAAVIAGFNAEPFFDIYDLDPAALAGALDQLSGEVHATAAGVGIEQERLLREAVLGRINAVAMAAREAPEAGNGAGVWAQLFGGWGHGDGDGNAARFEADRTGFATGIDFGSASEEGSWRAGVFGMHVQSDVDINALGSRAEVEQAGGGVYASVTSGGFGAAIGGYLTAIDLTATRIISLPGLAEVNAADTSGDARQLFAEVSYTIPAGKGMIRPFLGGTIGSFKLDAVSETGGSAALAIGRQSYSTATFTAGADGRMRLGKGLLVAGTLAGRAQLGDRSPQAQLALAAAPQQSFGVSGVQLDDVALAARIDATLELGRNVDFSVGYTGLIGSTISDHGARATLQVQF